MQMLQHKALIPGTVFAGRYELVKVLGSGAVGTVVHVLDRELDGLSLALKLLHPHLANDPVTIKRFCAESLLARQLCHHNIVRVYDVVSTDSQHFLTMEYIQGCGLDELLAGSSGRRLPFPEALFILEQVLTALTVAHEHGVVHRDLKPSNVLIDRAGAARLADFGLATSIHSAHGLTKTGELIGTPTYMSPEQFTGKCDPLSDLYSFGILAYELLVGAPPFAAESAVGLMQQHLTQPLPTHRLGQCSAPEWFVTLVERCTAKAIEQRPASARAALASLTQELSPSVPTVQRSLVAAVRQRERSHHLLSPSFRKMILSYWVIAVLVACVGVLYENNCRVKLAHRALQIQDATGLSAYPVLALLGYGGIGAVTREEIFAAVRRRSFYETEVLLDAGAPIDGTDDAGLSLVHLGLDGDLSIFYLLLERGAPVDLPDRRGDTPLLAAVRRGMTAYVTRLLQWGASLTIAGRDGDNALHLAIAQGDGPLVRSMAEADPPGVLRVQRALNSAGLNTMHIAAQKRDAGMLGLLIAMSFDVNMRDANGLTPAMRLVRQPPNPESAHAMAVLLKAHPDLNAHDNQGRTVFDHAEENGNRAWLELPELRR